jgi:hypothetical protein
MICETSQRSFAPDLCYERRNGYVAARHRDAFTSNVRQYLTANVDDTAPERDKIGSGRLLHRDDNAGSITASDRG